LHLVHYRVCLEVDEPRYPVRIPNRSSQLNLGSGRKFRMTAGKWDGGACGSRPTIPFSRSHTEFSAKYDEDPMKAVVYHAETGHKKAVSSLR
jgi:hypothetical protein